MSDITLEQLLAQRRQAADEADRSELKTEKLVIFDLAGQRFAFPGEVIREILADSEVYFVAGCPPTLEGVINVRGDIESVLRLGVLLRLPPGEAVGRTILIGEAGGMRSGIRVDRVVDVSDIPEASIQPPPAALPDTLRPYVRGVLNFLGQPVAVLDLESLFGDYARGLG